MFIMCVLVIVSTNVKTNVDFETNICYGLFVFCLTVLTIL
jgi:hypothetical protein